MQKYLLIETRDPVEAGDTEWTGALALALSRKRAEVIVFLTENAVLGARAGADAPLVHMLDKKNVKIVADQFALHERGVSRHDLAKQIDTADISMIAECMANNARVIWR